MNYQEALQMARQIADEEVRGLCDDDEFYADGLVVRHEDGGVETTYSVEKMYPTTEEAKKEERYAVKIVSRNGVSYYVDGYMLGD